MSRFELHPSWLERKIIHFDMDAFYASVEERKRPELIGKPLVIGGSPHSRGVVCTANYAARKFGIRSAMPCSKAYRLCPQAIFLAPNFNEYSEVSAQIHEVFKSYTAKIEPLALDEAYLDVTEIANDQSATSIAFDIQKQIKEKLGLSGSAGVAPNKLLAKLASDYEKPGGLTVVQPGQVMKFLESVRLRALHGVGPALEEKLLENNFKTCPDIWKTTIAELEKFLSERTAKWLYDSAHGIDQRPLQISRIRKSIGKEKTFSRDVDSWQLLYDDAVSLLYQLIASLHRKNLQAQTVTLKIKFNDFEQITRSVSLKQSSQQPADLLPALKKAFSRTKLMDKPVRLIGVNLSKLNREQLSKDHLLNTNSGA